MKHSEALDTLIANYPGYITMKDTLGYYTYCSPRFCALLGVSEANSFYAKTDWDIFPASVASIINQNDKQIINHHSEYLGEETLFIDGQLQDISVNKKPLLNEQGDCVGVISYATLLNLDQSNLKAPDVKHFLYENLIRNLPQNIFWLDTHNIMVDCNESQAKLFGMTRDDVIGKSIFELTKYFPDSECMIDVVKNNALVINEGKELVFEETAATLNGEHKTFISHKKPLVDYSGKVIGIFGVAVDISERKDMENALKSARELAEIANRAKTEFIMNISHDIRTPFSGIIGATELILNKETDPEKKYLLETIESSGKHLLSMLNNIIEVAKAENNIPQEPETFDFHHQFQETAALFITEAKTKKIELLIEQDPRIPTKVIGLKRNFQRVLLNLIGNAMKFTEQGRVTAKATLIERSLEYALIKIIISDTGIGIPQDQLTKIFEKFHRVAHDNNKTYTGSGLGLSIVKQFIEAMNGQIHVKSELGKGTSIEIKLQFKIALSENRPMSIVAPVEHQPMPEKILVVEDDYISRRIATMLLKHHFDSEIVEAPDALTALELCQHYNYKLIVTDIGLPDLGGPELALKIRETPHYNDALIIGLTAHIDYNINDHRNRAIDCVLSKPLNASICGEIHTIWNNRS
jgi:two-component system aerobic respiration control sensor histidine kinase ArcB